ncbi:rod shape-determining protein MreD [Clostridium sp. BJN0001]|uniref:rod shape-determining protein MreD n=1 Tax=Clostridium sp. BJN0001 TaxID=2930219 RepID=UPI001FD60003|nr:rod shape-determining protein MreD [Clostridium sp. BJN0001]
MKKAIFIIIMILLAILDNSVIPFFPIHNAYPSILFVFSIACSFCLEKKYAVLIGIGSGILQDLFLFNLFGLNSFTNLIICYITALIAEVIVREKRMVPIISTFVFTILKYFIIAGIYYFLKLNLDFSTAIIASIYNSVIMFIIYGILLKYTDNDSSKHTWRFK